MSTIFDAPPADDGGGRAEVPEGFLDTTPRARVAQVALGMNVAWFALYLVVLAAQDLVLPSVDDLAVWDARDRFWDVAEPIEIVLRLCTAVVFLVWLHRASKNAHVLSETKLQFTPGAAVGVWFAPCVNAWVPYQVVREIDRASAPEPSAVDTGLVAGWWACWIGSLIITRFVLAQGESVETTLVAGSFLAHLTAAVLAILVVERIRKNQLARATRDDIHGIAATFA
ncbi:DUF4328 domain-containing protein [Sandaracinus amylolyticus]|uniref:DUF4328 domain-containing protein n=1 Tax=Sandaracinus amylolyticus TaxID=927083 RepID=A0A0F6YMX0_9BACT|nr:DUF4328 domain-containing protein [Sandaracinus amylolyticus]AKF11553.1 hypothetical protein DB32_008702 [Sandaracinus amylolyticus]